LKQKTKNIEVSNLMLDDLKKLILESKSNVAVLVNSTITILYWKIGRRIQNEVLIGNRASYGKQIVVTLSRQLVLEFGNGFTEKNLWRMIQFYNSFPEEDKIVTLSRHLSWSHFIELLPINLELQRMFYIELCINEKWSVRELRNRTNSLLYERTLLSRKPEELVKLEINNLSEKDIFTPDIILKDPYILDFLDLKDRYLEKDLEDAILREMENFILELGVGFTFIARQKRIQIDNDDFYIDLLFYNRKLKRLIAIDLKLGSFKAEYKGQMELYLRYLDKYVKEEGENSPIGIILCSSKKHEQIELLELDKSGIHVAEYLTVLPPKKEFENRLNKIIANSKNRFNK
jgi:predicted nuclease of restriction endonuclease-like (RecB) superfamily